MQPQKSFDAIAKLVSINIQKLNLKHKSVDQATCISIYQEIYKTFIAVLEASNVKISNEAVNYAAQQVYDGVKINEHIELIPTIFDKRASLDDISTKDLLVLSAMFMGSDFRIPIILKLKNRS